MASFDKGSPRLYPHCFDRQPPLSLICLGSSHHYPHLAQVAPVVSNLVRKPPQQRQPPCCQHGINRQPPGNLQEAPIAFICGIVHKVAPLCPNAYNNNRQPSGSPHSLKNIKYSKGESHNFQPTFLGSPHQPPYGGFLRATWWDIIAGPPCTFSKIQDLSTQHQCICLFV